MLLLLVCALACTLVTTFPQNCGIHEFLGESRRYVIPHETDFEDSWLPTTRQEMMHHYAVGLDECNAFLSKQISSKGPLSERYPPPYQLNTQRPPSGQNLCRGNSMLYGLAGVVLWRFGPALSECKTYQHCWWGVLSCGKPNDTSIRELPLDQIRLQLEATTKSKRERHKEGDASGMSGQDPNITLPSLPPFLGFSLKSIFINARLVGAELVVPETRLLTLSAHEEALVFRFTLTQPHPSVRLEARLQDFYPSSLFNWSRELAQDSGMSYSGFVFLGGTENRCRPWTRCALNSQSTMSACDKASMLLSMVDGEVDQTEVIFPVACGSSLGCGRRPDLPLCLETSSRPGRWMAGELTAHRCGTGRASLPQIANGTGVKLGLLASGDPCIMGKLRRRYENTNEEEGLNHWFYSPYACRYHYYNESQLSRCFAAKNITHIHFQGDSMTRDMFAAVQKLLGVAGVSEDRLKILTNQLKTERLAASAFGARLLLTEGYFWDPDGMAKHWGMLRADAPLGPPQVIVANYAFAHRGEHPEELYASFEKHAGRVWARNFSLADRLGPRWRYFQTPRDPRGLKDGNLWAAHAARLRSEVLERAHAKYGFVTLDDFLILEGRFDGIMHPGRDGWHHYGSTRMMEATLLFNMLCNDLVRDGAI